MGDFKTELITRTMDYELKMIELENQYKEKNKDFDESKMRAYVNNRIKEETKELLNFNLNPAINLVKS